jgi:SH3 domain-containing YSC84-like protein 1
MRKIGLTSALVLAAALVGAGEARVDDLQELVSDARDSVLHFTSDPAMDWFRDNVKNAKGVLIIPRLLKGGFIFGGSGGSGVLLARDAQTGAWSYPAFYTLGSVTVGPQIGGEAAELILMMMTQRGLDSMMASSVKLGADVEVAAGPVGAGTKAATADVLAFSRTKGLFGGATVEGAWIGEREGWNERVLRPARATDRDPPRSQGDERTGRQPARGDRPRLGYRTDVSVAEPDELTVTGPRR